MRKRKIFEEKRKFILNYLKKNQIATHKEIRRDLKLNPNRYFKSLEYAFNLAGIESPRTFKIKTKEEKKKIIIGYIKKHPKTGGQTIAKDTKINPSSVFKNIEEAFKSANVPYPRVIDRRTKEEKRRQIINLIRENPLISIEEVMKKTKTQPYKMFGNMKDIYTAAGVNPLGAREKWRLKKQQEIINYIKNNPLATQREINKARKTHVQLIFKQGIFEAYEKAGIKFPYERLKLYGIGLKNIRDRAKSFEDEIAIKLSGYGTVNRLVRTKRGFADIIFERKDKTAIIEVKDYMDKDISISQINQLNKYLEDCNCHLGMLICHKKPKKDNFLMNKNKIFVLTKEELDKVPKIMLGP